MHVAKPPMAPVLGCQSKCHTYGFLSGSCHVNAFCLALAVTVHVMQIIFFVPNISWGDDDEM